MHDKVENRERGNLEEIFLSATLVRTYTRSSFVEWSSSGGQVCVIKLNIDKVSPRSVEKGEGRGRKGRLT
jgi:hypothetical protein